VAAARVVEEEPPVGRKEVEAPRARLRRRLRQPSGRQDASGSSPLLSPRIGILFVLFRRILEARRCTASSGAALRPAKNQ
jgi:hypothetical protein